jgi:ankyrin repeat protein
MNEPTRYTNSSNRPTVASVPELATDVDKCKAWLATRDGHTDLVKICTVFTEAIISGRIGVCQLILDSGLVDSAKVAFSEVIAMACHSGHLSVVQLLVSRLHPSTQDLYLALTTACTHGYVEIVTWLLGGMRLSRDMRWLLATASACGDIDAVRLLAVQAGVTSTEAMSLALRVACSNGNGKVVDWLMTHTTADVSLCSKLDTAEGIMTSLTAACFYGNVDTVVTLLQCVTPHTVNIQCGRYNDSALHFVIFFSNKENWKHSLHNACAQANIGDVIIAVHDTDVNMIDQSGSGVSAW